VSYVALNPSYYQMLQPESAWHAGAPGWSEAPYPGWGENPNLVGPRRLAIEGLGDDASDKQKALLIGLGYAAVAALGFAYLLTRK